MATGGVKGVNLDDDEDESLKLMFARSVQLLNSHKHASGRLC